MSVEHYRIDFSHRTVAFVDLADTADSSDRFHSIERCLTEASATPLSSRSFVLPLASSVTINELQILVEPFIKSGDSVLLIYESDSGMQGFAILRPPEGEGVSIPVL